MGEVGEPGGVSTVERRTACREYPGMIRQEANSRTRSIYLSTHTYVRAEPRGKENAGGLCHHSIPLEKMGS